FGARALETVQAGVQTRRESALHPRYLAVWCPGPRRARDRPALEREDANIAVAVGGAAPESTKSRVVTVTSGVIGGRNGRRGRPARSPPDCAGRFGRRCRGPARAQ